MVNQVYHDFHHHVLLLSAAFSYHQRQGHEGIICQTLAAVGSIENAIVVEEPEEERGGNALVGFAFLLRTSAIQASLIAFGLSSVAVAERMILRDEVEQHSSLLLYAGVKFLATEGLVDLSDAAFEGVVLLIAEERAAAKFLAQTGYLFHDILVRGNLRK